MTPIDMNTVEKYVSDNIGIFHEKRLDRIKNLRLNNILRKKNPYLFRAKNVQTSEEIIRSLTSAYLSSSEEGIFGDWLEGLAVFINNKVYGGWKSGIQGIDLEFDWRGVRYIVVIKSGPNWGNSSQIARMRTEFLQAKRTLRTSNSQLTVTAVNGCCYGKNSNPDRGDYYKYCGQRFWRFISGSEDLYTSIIEPLGYKARERNREFAAEYAKMINRFSRDFMEDFCASDGAIDWPKLVKFNSGK